MALKILICSEMEMMKHTVNYKAVENSGTIADLHIKAVDILL